jgi:hypothetical protein
MSVLDTDAEVNDSTGLVPPPVEHAPWCAPDRHHEVGEFDRWCRGPVQFVVSSTTTALDLSAVAVYAERSSHRAATGLEWGHTRLRVALQYTPGSGDDPRPDEAREVTRTLLTAADIAEGVSR